MSILVNKNTKVIVQGITGRSGRFHTEQCVDYGTQIVAGAVPGRGGTDVNGIPVFDTVAEGIAETGGRYLSYFRSCAFQCSGFHHGSC